MTDDQLKQQFQQIEDRFNKAVVSNSVEEIKKCITKDWVLVGEGGIFPQEGFFQMVEQGVLSHDMMTKEITRVKIYGNMAIVTGRGQNTGMWKGEPMEADEWITDVYRQENGEWLCVLTHLTTAKK